ncbi:uncharacterized protein V6R79_024125 [Siganus canaliculatus]
MRQQQQTVRRYKLTETLASLKKTHTQRHAVVEKQASLCRQETFLRHDSRLVNFSSLWVTTCATHRSDGNAPQTPLSQSDILSERTPLRLNFEKDLLFRR